MIKIVLFLISYIPLYIVLLCNNLINYYNNTDRKMSRQYRILNSISTFEQKDTLAFYIIIGLITVPIVLFFIFLLYKISTGKSSLEYPENYKKTGDTIINYLITYIIPFFSMDIKSPSIYFWGNIILILVVMVLFIRLDAVYLNPPLILLGFYIFTDENENKYYLTRNSLTKLKMAKKAKDYLKVIRITSNFYYIRRYKIW